MCLTKTRRKISYIYLSQCIIIRHFVASFNNKGVQSLIGCRETWDDIRSVWMSHHSELPCSKWRREERGTTLNLSFFQLKPFLFWEKWGEDKGNHEGIVVGSEQGRRNMEAVLFLDWLHHSSLPPPHLLPSPLVAGLASTHKHSRAPTNPLSQLHTSKRAHALSTASLSRLKIQVRKDKVMWHPQPLTPPL